MAELADAQDLKSCGGDTVWVRFPLAALALSAEQSTQNIRHVV